MLLLDLPLDVLVSIFSLLDDRTDFKHLSEVSKSLYTLVVPMLYESITVEAEDELRLHDINVEPLLRTRHNPINFLSYAKHIQIESSFRSIARNRCVHNYPLSDTDEEDESERENTRSETDELHLDDEDAEIQRVTKALMPLLKGCKDDSIRSFSWEMGTCLPDDIFGAAGYLASKQKHIESIRLITDPTCDSTFSNSTMKLTSFRHLRSISWKGIQSCEEIESLAEALEYISEQLSELELDFID